MANTVIKATPKQIEAMQTAYLSHMSANIPAGAIFAVKKPGLSITAYKSGKVMFQGTAGEREAAKWGTATTPKAKTAKVTTSSLPVGFSSKNVAGSDEVGTGDYFGPMIVSACYVDQAMMPLLKQLGVKDSKAMTDPEICSIAKKIIPVVPHSTLVLPNPKYNELQANGMNQGQMKAILHNRALENVLTKIEPIKPDAILIDQFAEKNTYYRYLAKEPTVVRENVFFATKAEGLHLAVAAASIIARSRFVEAFREMELELGLSIPKGAGARVDQVAADILDSKGEVTLQKYTKWHFANTTKAKNLSRRS
ncbi:ribonuclease HIII [Listeria weihenstephanensis]|uniref:Ribonuclease HIII n=1 Tax=Listeria weihenstephanensis TaxID=1006155 RepID=A0A841Z4Q7_9LIST|nr:ribonuclease HIII [Listeria weihenstephanensis]MBC1499889.1 ribonuclease HIII [Listeria weihenstephanensis]